ncbi:hypothetical protein ACXX9E_29810 [Pseudomonas sp. GNP014]
MLEHSFDCLDRSDAITDSEHALLERDGDTDLRVAQRAAFDSDIILLAAPPAGERQQDRSANTVADLFIAGLTVAFITATRR